MAFLIQHPAWSDGVYSNTTIAAYFGIHLATVGGVVRASMILDGAAVAPFTLKVNLEKR
jgi:hypothetical protein